ncbi:hypothetical protein MKW92_039266 [Papaver armeniacum]|nr:hypothetical protein MKW92_039266 [Papaver armeniacum]
MVLNGAALPRGIAEAAFYTDDAPGLKISPKLQDQNVELVMSIGYLGYCICVCFTCHRKVILGTKRG